VEKGFKLKKKGAVVEDYYFLREQLISSKCEKTTKMFSMRGSGNWLLGWTFFEQLG